MTVYGNTLLDSAGAYCLDAYVEPHGWILRLTYLLNNCHDSFKVGS